MQYLWSLVPRLLSVLAVVGLLTAPLAMPLSAAVMDDVSMAVMSEMAPFSDDMPCCPHQNPVLPDCSKFCPLAGSCLGMSFPGVPAAFFTIPARFAVADVRTLGDDSWRDFLLDPPAPRPPRS